MRGDATTGETPLASLSNGQKINQKNQSARSVLAKEKSNTSSLDILEIATMAPPYGEPDWATPGDTTNQATTQIAGTGGGASAVGAAPTNINSGESRYV